MGLNFRKKIKYQNTPKTKTKTLFFKIENYFFWKKSGITVVLPWYYLVLPVFFCNFDDQNLLTKVSLEKSNQQEKLLITH